MNKIDETRRKIKRSEFTFGGWIQIGHPMVAEIMACQGFDWICVDLEHGVIDIETMTNIFRAIDASKILPMARLPKNDDIWIRRCLDAGAGGLIIPMINSVEEACSIIKSSKYPPIGMRGYGYSRANKFGEEFNEYVNRANNEVIIIAQIEHKNAIDELENILEVDGIDGVFIGPLDLSGSYNKIGDMESTEMITAFQKYLGLCKKKSKPAGFHIIRPDEDTVKWALRAGFNFIALGLDVVSLSESCKRYIKLIES